MSEGGGTSALYPDDPRFLAAVKMIERTGAREFQLRWQDDQEPTVWIAVAKHLVGPDGRPAREGEVHWQAGAGMTPYRAAFALAEALVDGGTCAHCHRPSGVTDDLREMPMDALVCWYAFDPELAIFRRACEGDTP